MLTASNKEALVPGRQGTGRQATQRVFAVSACAAPTDASCVAGSILPGIAAEQPLTAGDAVKHSAVGDAAHTTNDACAAVAEAPALPAGSLQVSPAVASLTKLRTPGAAPATAAATATPTRGLFLGRPRLQRTPVGGAAMPAQAPSPAAPSPPAPQTCALGPPPVLKPGTGRLPSRRTFAVDLSALEAAEAKWRTKLAAAAEAEFASARAAEEAVAAAAAARAAARAAAARRAAARAEAARQAAARAAAEAEEAAAREVAERAAAERAAAEQEAAAAAEAARVAAAEAAAAAAARTPSTAGRSRQLPAGWSPIEGVPEMHTRPRARRPAAATPASRLTFTPMEGVPETARGFGRRPAAGSSGGRLQQQRKPVFTPVEGVPEKDLSFGRTPFNRQAASAAAQLERALEAAAAGGGGSSEVTTGAATNSAGPGVSPNTPASGQLPVGLGSAGRGSSRLRPAGIPSISKLASDRPGCFDAATQYSDTYLVAAALSLEQQEQQRSDAAARSNSSGRRGVAAAAAAPAAGSGPSVADAAAGGRDGGVGYDDDGGDDYGGAGGDYGNDGDFEGGDDGGGDGLLQPQQLDRAAAAASAAAAGLLGRGAAAAAAAAVGPTPSPQVRTQLPGARGRRADGGEEVAAGGGGMAAAAPAKRRRAVTPYEGRRAKQRKSLAGDGLIVAPDGRRMSQRTHRKPLEWYRNEHVEYTRDHKSLPTVSNVVSRTPDPCWPAPTSAAAAHPQQPAAKKARTKPSAAAAAAAAAAAQAGGSGKGGAAAKKGGSKK